MGDSTDVLKKLLDKTHPFARKLANARCPLIILGTDQLKRSDGPAILSAVQTLSAGLQINAKNKVLNVLHKVASQVAALDLGYTPGVQPVRDMQPKVLFLLGADEEAINKSDLPKDCFVVYIGKLYYEPSTVHKKNIVMC